MADKTTCPPPSSNPVEPSPSSSKTSDIKLMDTELYNALKKGETEIIQKSLENGPIHDKLTLTGNTVLHVLAQFPVKSEIIDKIIGNLSPTCVKSMLTKQNSEGETALHIAARNGRSDIVQALINHAKKKDEDIESGAGVATEMERVDNEIGAGVAEEMLRMTNKHGDTALHEAVRYNRKNVVDLLLEEDPNFQHPSNNTDESPLYLAVKNHKSLKSKNKNKDKITRAKERLDRKGAKSSNQEEPILQSTVWSILWLQPSANINVYGPEGRTALHAAIMNKCFDCTFALLLFREDLAEVADKFGWTPLHYAALCDFKLGARLLVMQCKSVAHYTLDKDDNKTALHVAACYGSVEVMKEILRERPDCWEMITREGQNVIHLAVTYEREKALDFILSKSWARNLINQKDAKGNKPSDLYAISKRSPALGISSIKRMLRQLAAALIPAYKNSGRYMMDTAENFRRRELLIEDVLKERGAAIPEDRNVINEQDVVASKITASKEKDLAIDLRKLSETHLIVAALIASVAFAAGFSMPGGYQESDGPDQGMAILIKRTAFKTFVITDTIAVMSSIIAVALHLKASLFEHRQSLLLIYDRSLFFIQVSLVAMAVAFITGVYTVLAPSLALAIIVCVIGCYAVVHFDDVVGIDISSNLSSMGQVPKGRRTGGFTREVVMKQRTGAATSGKNAEVDSIAEQNRQAEVAINHVEHDK